MSSPYPHAPAANFSSRTLQTGIPREPEDALSPARGSRPPSAGPQMDWRLYPSFQGSGPPSMQPMEAQPSPILEALIRWLFCPGSAEGEVPLPPDGGQPTRAAVLKLSLAHPSKASNGHNNSYLQSTIAFTAWDPTGLYKRNKLIHTLTRRRLSPTPARQPPLGCAGAAVDLHGAPGYNGQAREGRMAGLWEAPCGPRPTHSACVILI